MRAQAPSVMFLAETWTNKARLELLPRRNKWHGLVIFWKADFDLEVETFSKYHINTTINMNKEDEWRLIGFYGEPETQKRHEAWAKLRSLRNRGPTPWLCAGDFNEIMKQNEKKGGRIWPHSQMQLFRDVLDECRFMDLDLLELNILGTNTLLGIQFGNDLIGQ